MAKSSQYVGVSWNARQAKWAAQVRKHYALNHLGYFFNEADAHAAVVSFKVANQMLMLDGRTPSVTEAFRYEGGFLFAAYNTTKHEIGDRMGVARADDGYVQVKYQQRLRFVHRVIWTMHNGAIPDGMEIDHINGNPADNVLENLRLVSRLENARNLKNQSRNTTGIPGVTFVNNHYRVTIGAEYLGYHDTLSEAIRIRKDAEKKRGYHANHGR